MKPTTLMIAISLSLPLTGCAVGKVVTAPVRAAGTVVETAVDATTQTKSEREEDLGRKILKRYKACLKEADSCAEEQECRDRYNIED